MKPTNGETATVQQTEPPPEDIDVFADVSHHGSSLFELLTLPNQLDTLSVPQPQSLNDIGTALHHSQTALHLHARAESTVLHPHVAPHPANAHSVSMMSPSTSHAPHTSPFQPLPPQVDSYCTVDPDATPGLATFPVEFDPLRYDASAPASGPRAAGAPTLPSSPAAPRQRKKKSAATSRADDVKRKGRASQARLPPARPISKRAPGPSPQTTGRKARPQTSSPPEQDTDASEQSDDYAKQRSPASNSQRTTCDNTSVMEDGANKDTHNSHTRRCRAKVNSKFQELLGILPTPPPKTGIKHKAQILDYTIRVFKDIHAKKTLLEAELALSSRAQLIAWVDNVVSHSTTLQQVLAPYLSLVCTKGSWKYSEAWVPSPESTPNGTTAKVEGISGESALTPAALTSANSKLRLGLAVIPSLGNSDDPDLPVKLERFRDRSRSYTCKPRFDLPGRIMCTLRPEWLPTLDDPEAFQRSHHTRDASLRMCFGVPLFVGGRAAAVAVFFDTEQRSYDANCVDLAHQIAGHLGNAFGASTFKD